MARPASIFYDPDYLEIQNHKQLLMSENGDFQSAFAIKNSLAVSLPQGLFGSVVKKNRRVNFGDFNTYWEETKQQLLDNKVKRVEMTHPSEIYQGYIPEAWLEEVGFSLMYEDINHHIELKKHQMHDMEVRKLKKITQMDYRFEPASTNSFGPIYDFLAKCRAEKGLVLNINKFRLGRLFMTFPDRYHLFAGYMGDELACATITLNSAPNVAYYFLPGTLEAYKKDSPMIALLHVIVDQFKGKYKYLDLGISSIKGKPQQGLIDFKERMGGIKTVKRRYFLRLT